MTTLGDLDWQLAWQRVKQDIQNRVFVTYPNEVCLIESDLEGWLGRLAQSVADGTYQPSPAVIVEVPKGGGLLRPGAYLTLAHHVVYTACVGACLPGIHDAVSWSQGTVDFGNQLVPNPTAANWIKR